MRWVLGLVGAVLVVVGMQVIVTADRGLVREQTVVESVPVSVIRPDGDGPFPSVVVAHGFSASSRIMDGIGIALARAGWVVAMPDFSGHGTNRNRLTDADLVTEVSAVAGWLAERRDVDSVSLLGHSMGAGAVTEAAPALGPSATVALSLPSADDLVPDIGNLLLLVGSAEPARFGEATAEASELGYPTGVIVGVEHISILFSTQTLDESVRWLERAVGRPSSPVATDWRMPAVGLVYLGSALLFWPLSAWAVRSRREWEPGRRPVLPLLLAVPVAALVAAGVVAVVPALADVVPLEVGGYLAAFFLVCGLVGWGLSRRVERPPMSALASGLGLGLYAAVALAVPAALAWVAIDLGGARGLSVAALTLALFVFGYAELLLTWSSLRYWRVILARLLVAAVLGLLAVVGAAPGFLLILVGLMVLLLPWFGAYGVRVAQLTGSPAAGALAQALPLALVVGVTTPLA